MKKIYYQQDLLSNVSNKKLKVLFKQIGSKLQTIFDEYYDKYSTGDLTDTASILLISNAKKEIKKFYNAVSIPNPLLVLLPNYLVKTNKGLIAIVNKETHPFYNLFEFNFSDVYQQDGVSKHDFSFTINEAQFQKFLIKFIFTTSVSNIEFVAAILKYLFLDAAKEYIEEKSFTSLGTTKTQNTFSYNHFAIDKHTTKNASFVNNKNLFYNFDSEYNFYIKEYENSISSSVIPTSIVPNYYATETYLNTEESDRIKNFVSLDNRLVVTEQSILDTKYFKDYANTIKNIELDEISSLSKISNYMIDSYFSNDKNNQLSSENFPYAAKLSFSNYENDSLISLIEEKKLDTLVVNNSHYLFANKTNLTSDEQFYVVEETITKTLSDSGNYIDYDGESYDITTKLTSSSEIVSNTLHENIFNFITDEQTTKGFVVYKNQDLAFLNPENKKYLNLLKKPIAVFPYLAISAGINKICKEKINYINVINSIELDVYPLCYQVEKVSGNTTDSIISIARNSTNSEITLNDTQLTYGKDYQYKIYAVSLINTFGYMFDNIQYNSTTPSVTGQVSLKEDCKIYKTLVIDENFQIIDNPPTPVDVNIVPYIGVPNKLLFLLNTQNASYFDFAKPIRQQENDFFTKIRKKQNNNLKKVYFETVEDLQAVQIFRFEIAPKKYQDFSNNLYKIVSFKGLSSNSFVDTLEQNKKYYYTFRSIDVHDNISNPTEVFEVQIINNDGALYPIIKIFDMSVKNDFNYQKSFKKYLSINPSLLFTEIQKNEDGTVSIGTNSGLWQQRFKIRVTSKQSGKQFDVNLTYGKKTFNLINNTKDLNSDLTVEKAIDE